MNKQLTCIYPVELEPLCVAGKPCDKYDNPLSCAYYKQLKSDERKQIAQRDGQVVLE